jgi:hypothetical protein
MNDKLDLGALANQLKSLLSYNEQERLAVGFRQKGRTGNRSDGGPGRLSTSTTAIVPRYGRRRHETDDLDMPQDLLQQHDGCQAASLQKERYHLFKEANTADKEMATIRSILVEASKLEFSPVLRNKLDEILVIICSCRYPKNAEEYFVFLKAALENLESELSNGTTNEKSFAVVRTAVQVFKGLHQSNSYAPPNVFEALLNNLFPALVKSWEILTSNLEGFINNKHLQGLQINTQVDSLFLYMILNAGECPGNPIIEQCLSKLIDKGQTVLTLIKKNENAMNKEDELYEAIQADALVLLYDMTKLITRSPFSFSNLLKRLLTFSMEALKIEWRDPTIPKASLLLMYGLLKQFVYYCEPEFYTNSKFNPKYKVNPAIQQHCRSTYFEFLNKESTVQELVSIMILKLMSKDQDEVHEGNIDAEIEGSEVTGIDHLSDEIELPIKRICISLIELLSLRVPNIMVPMLVFLIESVVSGNMKEADLKIKDNVIMLIGLLPTVYQKLKRSDIPNIDGFLAWFSQQSKFISHEGAQYTFFSRRYSMLLRQWVEFLTIEAKMKVLSTYAVLPFACRTHQTQRPHHKVLYSTHYQRVHRERREDSAGLQHDPRSDCSRDRRHHRQNQHSTPHLASSQNSVNGDGKNSIPNFLGSFPTHRHHELQEASRERRRHRAPWHDRGIQEDHRGCTFWYSDQLRL